MRNLSSTGNRYAAFVDSFFAFMKRPAYRLIVLTLVSLALVTVPALVGLYDGMELLLMDQRFATRAAIRAPSVDSSVMTVDWDEQAILTVGRWPWTWDRHAMLLDMLSLFGARQVGIVDDQFSTPGALTVQPEHVEHMLAELAEARARRDTELAHASLPNYNEDLARAVQAYGAVFLCADFYIPEREEDLEPARVRAATESRKKLREADVEDAIRELDEFTLQAPTYGMRMSYDMKPPVRLVGSHIAGLGFNRIVQDPDGVVRRMPAVVAYDGRVYPTLALEMAAARFGIPLSSIRFEPGHYIELPGARYANGRPVRIPVDAHGQMNINWVGGYFDHIPHVSFNSLAQQSVFLAAKSAVHGMMFDDPTSPVARDGAMQVAFNTILSTRLVSEDDAMVLGWNVVDGLFAERYMDKGLGWEDYLALYLDGVDSGEIGLQRWSAVAINRATASALDRGETPDYQAILQDVGVADTMAYQDNFAQTLYFHRQGLLDAVHPLLFYENTVVLADNRRALWSPLDLRGKSIFVGLTATALNALNPTPYEERYQMLGLQPNAFNTILTGEFITEQPRWAMYLYMLVYALLVTTLVLRLGTAAQVSTALGVSTAHVGAAWWLFARYGIVLPIVAPVLAAGASYTIAVVFQYAEAMRERRRVRGLFAAMVSPQVLRILEESPEKLSIAGEKFDATMFSSDVSGFTTISEGVTAQELANILNIYLTPMSNLIMKYDGFVDKYEGDAIKAEFGVPLPDEGHPWKGVCAALEQQEELTVIARMLYLKYGVRITARMGVNTGIVAAGNMGSEKRMQYTVMGEQVTLAEELEPINKLYESWIAIGPDTDVRSRSIVETRHLDTVVMGPSHHALGIYEPLGWKKDAYLAYWRGKPVPPLLRDAWRLMMPEKVLGYVYYYERRALPASPMKERIVGTYRQLAPTAIEFLKTNDILQYLIFVEERTALRAALADAGGRSGMESDADAERAEIAALESRRDAATEPWQRVLADARVLLKRSAQTADRISGRVPELERDNFLKAIDTLEKKVESYSKRCGFATPDDTIAWDLAAHLKELLDNKDPVFLAQNRDVLVRRAAEKRRVVHDAMATLVRELDTPAGAEGYHEFIADHCAVAELSLTLRTAFADARAAYVRRDWDAAEAGMRACLVLVPQDGPAQKYIERIARLRKNPPPEGWDGHWTEE